MFQSSSHNTSFTHACRLPLMLLVVLSTMLIIQNGAYGFGAQYYEVEIPDPLGNGGVSEYIAYQIPSNPTGALMVAWHGWFNPYNPQNDEWKAVRQVFNKSDLDVKCEEYGLVLLSPLCKSLNNFGHLESQMYCTEAINYLRDELSATHGIELDTDRIYMAGFSMGAGAALSYACRHMQKVGEENPDPTLGEGYPVAGVMFNAGTYDYNNACGEFKSAGMWWGLANYNSPFSWKPTRWYSLIVETAPGMVTWIPIWQPPTPTIPPQKTPLFYYEQISTLFINGEYQSGYDPIVDLSMG